MRKRILWLIGALLGLGCLVGLIAQLAAQALWFQEVGYAQVFWWRLATKATIWAIATVISAFFLLSNLGLARKLKDWRNQNSGVRIQESGGKAIDYTSAAGVNGFERSQNSGVRIQVPSVSLRWLLPISFSICLAMELLVLHYGRTLVSLWTATSSQPDVSPSLPDSLDLEKLWHLVQQVFLAEASLPVLYLKLGVIVAGAIALLIYPQFWLGAIALTFSLAIGSILSTYWGRSLQFLHATEFGRLDPVFSKDLGFYIFSLPIWELLEFWLLGLCLVALLAVVLVYLLAGNSLSDGKFAGFSFPQRRHLHALGGGLMLAICFSFGIHCYELLYSTKGVVYGASYTDIYARLPVYKGLSWLAGAIALCLFWQALRPTSVHRQKLSDTHKSPVSCFLSPVSCLLLGYFLLAIATIYAIPFAVQSLLVQPNELSREDVYIHRTIDLTREAFALNAINIETFNPTGKLTAADLQANNLTIHNIRLWDTRPLLQTNRQLQQIRSYYRFSDADIDRYTFLGKQEPEKQQVLISARELDYSAVPPEAQTWVNEHLIYTHGYGFTLSPVNQVAAGGLPDYFVKNIGSGSANGGLTTSSEEIRASIPIGQPRIYYGEITNTYVMTGTRVPELDYPSGNENVYNTYDGTGGINIGAWWQRWLLAAYLQDWQMLLTNNFKPETKLLFRRNINDRIRAIAPFLRYDQDPYLVVADVAKGGAGNGEQGVGETERKVPLSKGGLKPSGHTRKGGSTHNEIAQTASNKTPNYLYWVVDAYTTSDRYPYSEPSRVSATNATSATKSEAVDKSFNYIRNSVKVVIDAYNGSVDFYIADPRDPIIQTWQTIFPNLFKPLSAMPAALRSHIRYPADLFAVQAERLLTYHMTNAQVFYNREDQWQIPKEIYGNQTQLVEPYYLITKLPTGNTEEFITLLPYTPNQRTNLTAWLAARSDGENYGKSLLYVFPKQKLVYGTEQIEARINQDPVISQQISLWNRQGSRALQGNLLVIPIDQSLLYVEPLYLEAEQNSLPTLARVIVAYENRIVMAETLEKALQAIFQPEKPETPAIVRPVE